MCGQSLPWSEILYITISRLYTFCCAEIMKANHDEPGKRLHSSPYESDIYTLCNMKMMKANHIESVYKNTGQNRYRSIFFPFFFFFRTYAAANILSCSSDIEIQSHRVLTVSAATQQATTRTYIKLSTFFCYFYFYFISQS